MCIAQILPLAPYGYFDPETIGHVRHLGYFLGGASRPGAQQGWIDTLASNFSELPQLIRRGLTPSDIVFSMASPMDEHGYFSLSLGTDYTMAASRRAGGGAGGQPERAVCLRQLPCPYLAGRGAGREREPVLEVGLPTIGPVQEAIGKYVADMIDDGSTLQIGYGGIPGRRGDAADGQARPGHPHRDDRRRHPDAGRVRRRHQPASKNYLPGKMVATFALGSASSTDFMHRNPALEMHPVDFTNDPYLAGRNDKLCSINATLQIDLLGQCGSESTGPPALFRHRRPDRLRARGQPLARRQGLHRAALDRQERHHLAHRAGSRAGTHVSTSKNDVNYVVTEYGVAQLRGKSMRERARALISIAHSNFRPALEEQASRLRLA